MPATATDRVERLIEALVLILKADTTPSVGLVALMGRSTGLLVPAGDAGQAKKPAIAYLLIDDGRRRIAGGRSLISLQFDILAEGDTAQALANAIAARLEVVITSPSLATQGVDAVPSPPRRRTLAPDVQDGTQAQARRIVEQSFEYFGAT